MRRQLLELGLSADAIKYRLRVGRFHVVFPGVYAVGHEAISPTGRALAAVMATWPGAAASHETVLGIAGLIEPSAILSHVTTVQHREPRPGLVVHRAALPTDELRILDGVPATTLARAFLDVAPRHDPAWVRRLIKNAEFAKLLTIPDLVAVLDRHPRRRGRRALAAIVEPLVIDDRPTRSELEDRFLAFCRRRCLPLPETNVRLMINGRRFEADCIWPGSRLVVELDGRDGHARELAFSSDRAKDRALIAAGWVPLRIPWGQLAHDGDELEADLRRSLALLGDPSRIAGAGDP